MIFVFSGLKFDFDVFDQSINIVLTMMNNAHRMKVNSTMQVLGNQVNIEETKNYLIKLALKLIVCLQCYQFDRKLQNYCHHNHTK